MSHNNNNLVLPQVIIGILLTGIIILSTYFIVDMKVKDFGNSVVAKMLAIEYDKVGGMENYVKINEIQKKQIIEGLKQFEANGGVIPTAPQANNQPVPTPAGATLDLEQVKKITTESVYILGSPDAEISFVEYSDLECPFCKKLHESGVIERVLESYDGKINFIFKQFPLAQLHPQAPMEAMAALCVGDIAGGDKYYEFINTVFKKSAANGRSFTADTISDLAGNIGVDKTEVLSCISSNKFANLVQSQTAEGAGLFGLTGTPGNVLINNKTGKWDKLPGAYGYDEFKQKIDSLLQ